MQRQRKRRGVEGRIHRTLGPLTQIATLGGSGAVGRLTTGYLSEWGAVQDLLAGGIRPRTYGRRVRRSSHARQRHIAQVCRLGTLKFVPVGLVVGGQFGIAYLDRGIGHCIAGDDGGETNLHHFMLVPVPLPERSIRQVDVRGHQPEKLGPLELIPILGLEAGEILLGDTGREPALVLGQIKLAIGLEFGDLLKTRAGEMSGWPAPLHLR